MVLILDLDEERPRGASSLPGGWALRGEVAPSLTLKTGGAWACHSRMSGNRSRSHSSRVSSFHRSISGRECRGYNSDGLRIHRIPGSISVTHGRGWKGGLWSGGWQQEAQRGSQ